MEVPRKCIIIASVSCGQTLERPECPGIKDEPEEQELHIGVGVTAAEPCRLTKSSQTENEQRIKHEEQLPVSVKTEESPRLQQRRQQPRENMNSETEGDTEHSCDYEDEDEADLQPLSSERKDGYKYHKVQIGARNTAAQKGRNASHKPYSCSVCNKVFHHQSHLNGHMRTHTGEKPYSCSVCNRPFSHRGHLNVHMRAHTGEKPYSCSVCEKSFKDKGTLVQHTRTHTAEKTYSCSVCYKSFSHRAHISAHMRIHTGDKPFSCSVCNKAYSMKSSLTAHMRTHTGDRPFHCLFCNMAFFQRTHLTAHIRTHTGEKPYSCTVCNASFSQTGTLSKHRRTHTAEEPVSGRLFAHCSNLATHMTKHTGDKTCDKVFSHKGYFDVHLRTWTGDKPHSCSVCNKAFWSTLTEHMRTLTGDKPVSSSVCNTAFSQKYKQTEHVGSHTFKETAKATSDRGLTHDVHMKIHNEDKPYSSSVCNTAFSQKYKQTEHVGTHTFKETAKATSDRGLTHDVHMKIHNEDKPYSSSVCNTAFSQKYKQTEHVGTHTFKETAKATSDRGRTHDVQMKIHNEDKPYSSSVCNTAFSQKYKQTEHVGTHTFKETAKATSDRGRTHDVHMKIHNEDKPYSSSVCNTAFSQKYKQTEHVGTHTFKETAKATSDRGRTHDVQMKIHNEDKPYSSSVCNTAFSQKYKQTEHVGTHTFKETAKATSDRGRTHDVLMKIHNEDKPYSSSVSTKAISPKYRDNEHVIKTILDKQVIVSTYNSSFPHRGNHNVHTSHISDKPYSCTVCAKEFSRRGHLNVHMRTHTGEKPYSCSICEKSFSDLSTLGKHKITHTGDRPYSCSVCEKAFSRRGNLKTHMTTHTGRR